MTITELELPGVLLFKPDIFRDDRGWFMESWHEQRYRQAGLDTRFVQDNVAYSRQGVLRGLHFQKPPKAQGKLVTVLAGRVFDVVADIRKGSPTFGRWCGIVLASDEPAQLYVPPGLAHGYLTLSPEAVFSYKCTEFYDAASEGSVRWNDEALGIDWPCADPILSEKDAAAPLLEAIEGVQFVYYDTGTHSKGVVEE